MLAYLSYHSALSGPLLPASLCVCVCEKPRTLVAVFTGARQGGEREWGDVGWGVCHRCGLGWHHS